MSYKTMQNVISTLPLLNKIASAATYEKTYRQLNVSVKNKES